MAAVAAKTTNITEAPMVTAAAPTATITEAQKTASNKNYGWDVSSHCSQNDYIWAAAPTTLMVETLTAAAPTSIIEAIMEKATTITASIIQNTTRRVSPIVEPPSVPEACCTVNFYISNAIMEKPSISISKAFILLSWSKNQILEQKNQKSARISFFAWIRMVQQSIFSLLQHAPLPFHRIGCMVKSDEVSSHCSSLLLSQPSHLTWD